MKSGRLLLADRHLGVLGGAHGLLHDLFDTVVMVADEQSLVEAVAERRPDLVIMDLSLPRGQEADLAGRLMGCHPDLRLVVLSVHDEASLADGILAAGAAGFVVKRAVGTDLLPAVRAALAGGTYVSRAVRSGGDIPPTRQAGDPPDVSR
jgi:DNA-binding NarL/FixJ family response regulator